MICKIIALSASENDRYFLQLCCIKYAKDQCEPIGSAIVGRNWFWRVEEKSIKDKKMDLSSLSW